jgi:hypothetical protein
MARRCPWSDRGGAGPRWPVARLHNASQGNLEWQKLRCYNGSMQKNSRPLADLTDTELLVEIKALAASEREATVRLIASLAELDARRLYLGEGFPSLFAYCTQCLHLSEHAAYNRIEAARAARKWPEILDRLADGSLTTTTARLLAPHLTIDNRHDVLAPARHKSKREVEQIVAALHPLPDVAATIRKLPARSEPAAQLAARSSRPQSRDAVGATTPPPVPASDIVEVPAAARPSRAQRAVVAPLAPERFKVQLTVSRETHDRLRRAQDLLRHSIPNGDPAEIFDRALTLLIEHLERTRLGSAKRPRQSRAQLAQSRHIPSAVKRDVWQRDAGRCAFVGTEGRCAERGFLQFHHVVPYAGGGPATVENIQLRCRAHNQFEAEEYFGTQNLFVRECTGYQERRAR